MKRIAILVSLALAVTPAAGFVGPISAVLLGAIAAVPSYFGLIIRAKTSLDDSLDVVAAHGLGGTVGALLTGVFATKAINSALKLPDGTAAPLGWVDGNSIQVLNQATTLTSWLVMVFQILRVF